MTSESIHIHVVLSCTEKYTYTLIFKDQVNQTQKRCEIFYTSCCFSTRSVAQEGPTNGTAPIMATSTAHIYVYVKGSVCVCEG